MMEQEKHLVGTLVDSYQITALLASSATASVYQAEQTALNRKVILKVFSPFYSQLPGLAERLPNIARLWAQLEHVNILPLYSYGSVENLYYLAMRLAPYGNLRQRLDSATRPYTPTQSQHFLIPICAALDAAHQQGVIHGNVTPNNILFAADTTLLTDFGMTFLFQGYGYLAQPPPGNLNGQYLAPEVASGKAPFSSSSDLFSLGVILFQLLTGHLPFEAVPPAFRPTQSQDRIPDPAYYQPSLGQALREVVRKSLAQDPAARFPTAQALLFAIQSAIESQTSQEYIVPPVPVLPPTSATGKRKRGNLFTNLFRRQPDQVIPGKPLPIPAPQYQPPDRLVPPSRNFAQSDEITPPPPVPPPVPYFPEAQPSPFSAASAQVSSPNVAFPSPPISSATDNQRDGQGSAPQLLSQAGCPACGSPVREGAIFCYDCGQRLLSCPQCSKDIVVGTRFCPQCGFHLRGKEIPQAR